VRELEIKGKAQEDELNGAGEEAKERMQEIMQDRMQEQESKQEQVCCIISDICDHLTATIF
jgi:hypothetical protein